MEREVDEQVEEELGRFLLSLVQGEDGLVHGEYGPGDVVIVVDVVSTSNDLIRDSVSFIHISQEAVSTGCHGLTIRIIFSP